MKGAVFNLLNEMVEEEFGFEAWEALLQNTQLDGIYVATESYPDEELFSLVAEAEKLTQIPANDLVRSLGKFMLPDFAKNHPVFFEGQTSLKNFLLTVDRVIHVEVRKLFPGAGLPSFEYACDPDDEKHLIMYYRSPRKLCALSEGLIDGAAEHFKQKYTLDHDICMHKGSDHCELKLEFH